MVDLNTWAGLEPAVMDIKTVSGLAQVFELTLTDSTGSAVDLDGVTFRGAVNTAPLREFICSVEGEKVLFGWTGLPAGRHSFDLFMVTGSVEKALIHGAFAVAGRVLPPLNQESYSVNNAATLVFPDTVDGAILVELSEVGLVDLLSRKAGAFAEEAKRHLVSIRELKEWIGGKVDGFGDVVETATTAITEAGTAAVGAVEAGRTEAVKAVSVEKEGALTAVQGVEETATTVITEARTDAVKAISAEKEGALAAVNGAGETAIMTITEAGTEAVKTISAKKDTAVSSIQGKQADSVLAVGRASQTAQQNITSAQSTAVSTVVTARTEAVEIITPLVVRAETAKGAIDQAEGRIKMAETNAGASATNAANSAAAAQQVFEAIPQVDAGGNMTLAGGLTAAGTINANGGINIPEAAGLPADTSAASRAYAVGMAHLVSLHMTRLYWHHARCTVTGGLTLDHCSPGSYCQVSLPANKRATLYMPTVGALGAGNYGKTMGYIIPVVNKANSGESWHKVTMLIGEAADTWAESVDGGVDDFRWRPVSGDSIFLRRAIEITIYSGNGNDGYKVRVRELVPVGNPRSYVVRTTTSVLPYNSNTTPQTSIYKIVISQGKYSANDSLAAGVWAIMGGHADDTVIKLADIRGWEGYHIIYPPDFFYDILGGPWGGHLWMESPSVINGIGQTTYIKHALEPYQRSWVTSITEEPYIYPVQ